MSLKNVDIESAMRRLAERRIEEAMKEGKFDNLAGAGAPIDLEPAPADENARMMWWTLRIMRQYGEMPKEVLWRKALDRLRNQLDALRDESRLEALVTQFNELVKRINTMGANAINIGVGPLNLEEQRRRLRERIVEG